MRIIGHEDIVNLRIDPAQMYGWVDDVLRHKHKMLMPAKISINSGEDRFWNTMPIVMPEFGIAGVKEVNRYPLREPALDSKILLYATDTGKPIALLDGNYITAMRTGAVAVHSADVLGVRDFTRVAIIGLGNTARAALLVLAHKHPDRDFEIRLVKYKNQHELFAERFSAYPNLHFSYYETMAEAAPGAQVIFSAATVFHEDICPVEVYEPGITIIPIHTRGFMQADLAFDKVYGDETSQIEHFRYFQEFPFFAEVADVINGKAPGRESAAERIIVYNIGIVAHDMYFAQQILAASTDGAEHHITEPQGKFWV